MRITDQDRQAIAEAITRAEKTTSGEIFCVVTRSSDDYRFIPLLWAALAALVLPAPLILFTLVPAQAIYLAQLVCFLVLAPGLSWWPLRIKCVPPAIRRRRAHARALELFLAHGLHTTSARTGVLLFLSLAERHAEVVADEGIYARVAPDVWDEAVAALVAGARKGAPGEAFIAAIEICGKVLTAHFPPRADDRDELANQLVEL
jgi:putative membrane protein